MISPIRILVALGCLATLTSITTASHLPSRHAHKHHKRAQCQPFSSTFPEGSVADTGADFVSLGADGTYEVGDGGLQMYLRKPQGDIITTGNTNNVLGFGACINTTATYQYGRFTTEVKAPAVGGTVTAVIMLSPILPGKDEIDQEILGGNSTSYATNVFVKAPTDTHEIYGVFGGYSDVGGSITEYHNYTIDWNENTITWLVNGNVVRVLEPDMTIVNGSTHYPTHAGHIQFGIWDASGAKGTSHWAYGPIDWDDAPDPIVATVRSFTVECPYGTG